MIKWIEKLFDFMASIKLAVIVILSLGILSAVGTVYESMYDRVYAQKLIYHSFWMWMVLGLLAVNITAVMIDRWPWKKHHISFILAHIGILLLLAGSVQTYVTGIDGSMVFEIGGNNRFVQLQEDEIAIYTSMDGKDYRVIHQQKVDLFNKNLKANPIDLKLMDQDLKVFDYIHFSLPQQKLVSSKEMTQSPAVQFLIEGSRANQSSWLFKDKTKMFDNFQLGPASVTLAGRDYQRVDGNELIFKVIDDQLHYQVFSKDEVKPNTTGVWKRGDVIQTGWMDFKVRVLNFYPNAEEQTTFLAQEFPSAQTTSALKISYKGKEYDVGHNRPLKIFEADRVHVFSYGSIRYDIGFDMKVTDFRVGRYEGTQRAASYESTVEVIGDNKPIVISMNEPMKKAGLTFYQSSFQEDEKGQPTHSVFSVNKDPGRFLKYLGSLLIFLGIFMLFYFKDIYSEKYKKRFGNS
jgi:cytochrome c biogenesis protein ResB